MCRLASAESGGWTAPDACPRPALQELVGAVFVHSLRLELLPAELEPQRSAWLLERLGPASTSEPPPTFRAWSQLLASTHALDLRGGEKDGVERSQLWGNLKTRARELLTSICKPGPNKASLKDYGELCRCAGQLVSRSLAADGHGESGWAAEFEAAVSLVERPGPQALRAAEQLGEGERNAILEPSLAFLHQVTASAASFCPSLEHKRIDFLSHWAQFYRHFAAGIVDQVLRRLLAIIEGCAVQEPVNLRQRAMDTLVSLANHGALRPEQLSILMAESQRLAPVLPPVARAKLVEACAVAASTCGQLQGPQKAELIWAFMEQATSSWQSMELPAIGGNKQLAEAVVAAAAAEPTKPGGSEMFKEPHIAKLRELRTLLLVFTGVVARINAAAASSDASTAQPGSRVTKRARTADASTGIASVSEVDDRTLEEGHLAARVVQAWAPGIFALHQSLLGLVPTSGAGGPIAEVLSVPGDLELFSILGKVEGSDATRSAGTLPTNQVRAVRNILWELRTVSAKAVRACLACADFWKLPDAGNRLLAMAESLPLQPTHVAELLLKEAFGPLVGLGCAWNSAGLLAVPVLLRAPLCRSLVPPLASGIAHAVRESWRRSTGEVPTTLEEALAQSVVPFSRISARVLAALAGAELHNASLMASPESRLSSRQSAAPIVPAVAEETGALSQSGLRRKNRNRNRYAALAEDAKAEGESGSAAPAALPTADLATDGAGSAFSIAALVQQDRPARDAVRAALVALLEMPERETVQRALVGLNVWSVQLWNSVVRGQDPAAAALGVADGHQPQVGEFIHAAADALRALPEGVVRPVATLVAVPPVIPGSAGAAAGASGAAEQAAACCTLATIVRHPWTEFVSSATVNGKPGPSALVCEAAPVMFTVISIVTRLFKIQCRKLNLAPDMEHIYLCPALAEVVQLCCSLPNTTKGDVQTLLNAFIHDEGVPHDGQRATVRALLHEASPAFAPKCQGV